MDPNQFKMDFTDTIDISDMDVRGRALSNVKVSNPNDVDCLGLVLYNCHPLHEVRNALQIGGFGSDKFNLVIKNDIEYTQYNDQYIENVRFADISMVRCSFTDSTFVNVSFEGCSIECCDFINCIFINCKFDSYYYEYDEEAPSSFLWMMACDFTGSAFEECYFWGDSEFSENCDSDREPHNVFEDITVISGKDPRNTFASGYSI